MKNHIDCLLLGPYEQDFKDIERSARVWGRDKAIYRELNLNFLNENSKPKHVFDLFKEAVQNSNSKNDGTKFKDIINGALLYLGSFLEARNIKTAYINSVKEEIEKFGDILSNQNILTIALIGTTYLTPLPIKELISKIKKYNKDAKIILGGPYVWNIMRLDNKIEIESILKLINADIYVNSSQGEAALVNVIDALKNQNSLDQIKNIVYKKDSKYIINPTEEENNLLSENMVNWSLFKNDLQPQVYSRTSISCPFTCSFCTFPSRMGKYRYLEVNKIKEELDAIEATGKVNSVRFNDDTFNVPVNRFKDILRMMIKNNYSFKWSSFLRCQYIDEETIELMAKSGCEAVHLGIESGNSEILKNMNKKSTVEQYAQGLKYLNKYGIISFATFVIGFPQETKETIKDTIEFIEKNKPTFYYPHVFFCSPVTPIWKKREQYGLQDSGYYWKHNTMTSYEAIEQIEQMILKINGSIYNPLSPEYVTYALSLGFSIDQIKNFCQAFSEGIKQKLINGDRTNASNKIIEEIKSSFIQTEVYM